MSTRCWIAMETECDDFDFTIKNNITKTKYILRENN